MPTRLSSTQIDRLGDRLRQGSPSESDLRLLDEYRRSFGVAYENVVRTIREGLRLGPTGRPAKSTGSIIEKLHRESIRLSQVQDIAGCRVVVPDIAEQERVVATLHSSFAGAYVVDRRVNPSYGYRAVHVIIKASGKLVEIQVRSLLQHLWAELSEKLSDVVDPSLKYGAGPDQARQVLAFISKNVGILEAHEVRMVQAIEQLKVLNASEDQKQELRDGLREVQEGINDTKKELAEFCKNVILKMEKSKGQKR